MTVMKMMILTLQRLQW